MYRSATLLIYSFQDKPNPINCVSELQINQFEDILQLVYLFVNVVSLCECLKWCGGELFEYTRYQRM